MIFLHCYSIDSDERTKIPLYLAVLSLILTALLYSILSIINFKMPWQLEPLYLSAPSALAIYFIVSELFDKYCWNWVIFQKIGLIKTPDLNGCWVGKVASSHDDHTQSYDVKVEICQQWLTINIVLNTQFSMSHSFMAGILLNDPHGITLHYHYINEPSSDAVSTMHSHRGTTWLIFNKTTNSLEGEYYTGRDRRTIGIIKLIRENNHSGNNS